MTAEQATSVVRSAERARVALPVRVHGRVRLVKHVVTEEVTQTFTVRREELRVEQVPGEPSDSELSWTYQLPEDDTERDFEIVLHAEQVRASVVVVPVERVRVSTRVVETGVVVSAELLSEQVVVEQDPAPRDPQQDSTTGTAAGGAPQTKETPA